MRSIKSLAAVMSPSCVAAVSTAWKTASMLSAASVSKRARAALVKVMEGARRSTVSHSSNARLDTRINPRVPKDHDARNKPHCLVISGPCARRAERGPSRGRAPRLRPGILLHGSRRREGRARRRHMNPLSREHVNLVVEFAPLTPFSPNSTSRRFPCREDDCPGTARAAQFDLFRAGGGWKKNGGGRENVRRPSPRISADEGQITRR